MPALLEVARAPLSSSPPHLQLSSTLHLLLLLPLATLSRTLPLTPSITPQTLMLTSLQLTIFIPLLLTLSPILFCFHPWVGQQQWLAPREH